MMERVHAGVERMQRFSAEVAHELRTPVARMRHRIEAGLDDARDPVADRCLLEQTLGDVDRLTTTIRAMLQLAHSEAGLDDARVEEVSLNETLAGIIDFFEPLAEEAEVGLGMRVSDDARLAGDPNWLRQMFANLVDNAIKFSPRGSVVAVSLERDGTDALVAIEDQGLGVPTEARERIFEAFHRLDSKAPGTGLGLPLAREIARAHGGDIELESELGKGSRFVVRLPLVTPAESAPRRRRAEG
jgi:signal transduction histidine kinase